MFERFTEKAIKVIMLAQEEARRLGHNFVGTEQILLGLIGEGTGVAAKVLKSMGGVNLKDARIEVEKIIGRGSGFVAVEIPFTPRAKRLLELSLEESRQLHHNYIGTEHLLLGLIREGEGVAVRVLENLGMDIGKVRTQVIRMLGETIRMLGETKEVTTVNIPFTPRVELVLELALEEALQMNHNYIGTEHLLLGLIREGEGVASRVLASLGVNLDKVQTQVMRIVGGIAEVTIDEGSQKLTDSSTTNKDGSNFKDKELDKNLYQNLKDNPLRTHYFNRVGEIFFRQTKNKP